MARFRRRQFYRTLIQTYDQSGHDWARVRSYTYSANARGRGSTKGRSHWTLRYGHRTGHDLKIETYTEIGEPDNDS